jgi:hypothetical protein
MEEIDRTGDTVDVVPAVLPAEDVVDFFSSEMRPFRVLLTDDLVSEGAGREKIRKEAERTFFSMGYS